MLITSILVLFFHLYQIFFLLLLISYYNSVCPKCCYRFRKTSVNEASKKDLQVFVIKLTERIPDPHHAKEHYQSFIKITILVKQSKIVTYQPTTFETQALLI